MSNNLERTAAYFRRHRRQWISAMSLMKVGGWCSWRSRVAECRTHLGMDVRHKTERTSKGTVLSFYK